MKHRKLQDLMSDKNITPEDVAQFILFETEFNDNDKFRVICDLIVCCEQCAKSELEAERDKLREALERISGKRKLYGTHRWASLLESSVQIAEHALNSKEG